MRGIVMKKYVKPELFFERYELSQHIADCTWEMNYTGGVDNCTGNAVDKGYPENYKLFQNPNLCNMNPDAFGDWCNMASTTSKVTFIS